MDALGKLEMCAFDQVEVVEIVREGWCGTGPFTAEAKPGDWIQRKKSPVDVVMKGFAGTRFLPDGMVVGVRRHEGLGNYDPTPILVLWFR